MNCLVDMKEWFTIYDQYRRTHCIVSDLIMGNEYVFRVFANNLVGPSPEPCGTKDSAYIQKTGGQQPHVVTSSGRRGLTLTLCPSVQVSCTNRRPTRSMTCLRLPSSRAP